MLPNEYPFGGFEKEVEQTIKYSASLTDETKMIAEYWADGPNSELPPGHWCLFGAAVSRRDNHSVDDDVKMFFALGNALFDGSIVAWDAKRYFDSVRPVTAVHFWKAGKMIRAWGGPYKGVVPMRGELWQPYQPDGTWYSMIRSGDGLVAVEPNHGDLAEVNPRKGTVQRIVDISASQGHIVPRRSPSGRARTTSEISGDSLSCLARR